MFSSMGDLHQLEIFWVFPRIIQITIYKFQTSMNTKTLIVRQNLHVFKNLILLYGFKRHIM